MIKEVESKILPSQTDDNRRQQTIRKSKKMFRTVYTKLPTLLLALLACFVTVSGPVRAITLAEESESEIADTLKAKEFCRQEVDSRRLRQQQVHQPIWRTQRIDEASKSIFPAGFHQQPKSIWLFSSPPLRAPPA